MPFQKGNKLGKKFVKGHTPWSKGKKFSKEHIENLKKSFKNRIITPEHRLNLSRALTGRIPWNKGKKSSKEHIENIRKGRLGKRFKKRIIKYCPICKIEFEVLPCRNEKIFCSRKCALIGRKKPKFRNRKGKNNANWQGGITSLRYQIWKSEKYKKWRGNIFSRYNKICQDCGSKDNVQVHHTPYEFAEILRNYNIKTLKDAYNCSALWDEDNGKVLCINCHRKTYKFKGNQFI